MASAMTPSAIVATTVMTAAWIVARIAADEITAGFEGQPALRPGMSSPPLST